MLPDNRDSELEAAVDARSHDLMKEFEHHFQEVIEAGPTGENRRDQVFQAWAIQKIAGLQLSIQEIAAKLNEHVGGKGHLN